jgi:hypothetical protein
MDNLQNVMNTTMCMTINLKLDYRLQKAIKTFMTHKGTLKEIL